MDKIKVIITNDQEAVKIPSGIRLLIRKCCNAVLSTEGWKGSAEISVNFVDNIKIRGINKEHRHIDSVTDVLSFPLGENGKYDVNPETGAYQLGDIVISMEKAVTQSNEYGHSLQREVAYLTVHAMLHLLGYDHKEKGLEYVRMREREEQVLAKLGLARDASYVFEGDV